jgi:hypothetical protein
LASHCLVAAQVDASPVEAAWLASRWLKVVATDTLVVEVSLMFWAVAQK